MVNSFISFVINKFLLPFFLTRTQTKPFVMKKQDGSNISYEGYSIDLLNELATMLKFTYEIYPSPDGLFGAEMENGTWNGMIGELVKEVSKNISFL